MNIIHYQQRKPNFRQKLNHKTHSVQNLFSVQAPKYGQSFPCRLIFGKKPCIHKAARTVIRETFKREEKRKKNYTTHVSFALTLTYVH